LESSIAVLSQGMDAASYCGGEAFGAEAEVAVGGVVEGVVLVGTGGGEMEARVRKRAMKRLWIGRRGELQFDLGCCMGGVYGGARFCFENEDVHCDLRLGPGDLRMARPSAVVGSGQRMMLRAVVEMRASPAEAGVGEGGVWSRREVPMTTLPSSMVNGPVLRGA